MTPQERFLSTLEFGSCEPYLREFGFWADTIRRWYKEGLERIEGIPDEVPGGVSVEKFWNEPNKARCRDLDRALPFDPQAIFLEVAADVYPPFERKTLEVHDDGTRTIRDERGITVRTRDESSSIPLYLSWPVNSRDDWVKIKAERFDPRARGRLPENWEEAAAGLERRTRPLFFGGEIGFFGSLRYLMGECSLLTGYYDVPDLIRTMITDLTEFWMELFDPILVRLKPDVFLMWEDMCHKTGPLISPEIFREFMLPAYQRFTSFLTQRGVHNIIVDTDGNCWKLIPLFLEGGVTGLTPMEVAAGMNVVEVRRKFPALQMTGGIDKRVLARDATAIEEELTVKIPFMVRQGGYIPHVDHLVPPDVSFENFVHYRKRLYEMTGRDWILHGKEGWKE